MGYRLLAAPKDKLDFLYSLIYIHAMPVLRRLSVKISAEDLQRLHSSTPRAQLLHKLKEAAKEANLLAHPSATYNIKKVRQIAGNFISLEDGTELRGSNLVQSWQGATFLAIGLCTIGPLLERRVSELNTNGDILAATLLDSAGSVAVEGVANSLNFHLCQWSARRGMNIGSRLSPGYGQWAIEEQKLLFSILSGDKIGVQLNEQCMMIPAKSISFCVGIGSSVSRYFGTGEPCQNCSMENCQYRFRNRRNDTKSQERTDSNA